MGFTKLDEGILRSSIWGEPATTRVVWIAFLASCDALGFVGTSKMGMQRACNVSLVDFDAAIKTLESPDSDSRSLENDGRRIEKVEGGWRVLNYQKYRNKEYRTRIIDGEINGHVYFASAGDKIKIGFSKNPWSRVSELKTANHELVLISTLRGDKNLESELHEMFAEFHISREWFVFSDEIRDYINKNTIVVKPVATTVATPYASASVSFSLSVLESFKKEVNEFTQFPESMRQAFINYWTEPNPSKTKVRFQLQKTWSTNLRLLTWAAREKMNSSRKSYGRQEVTDEELIEQSKIDLSKGTELIPWMNQPSN